MKHGLHVVNASLVLGQILGACEPINGFLKAHADIVGWLEAGESAYLAVVAPQPEDL